MNKVPSDRNLRCLRESRGSGSPIGPIAPMRNSQLSHFCGKTYLCLDIQSVPLFLELQGPSGAAVVCVCADLKDRAALSFYRGFKQWEC